MRKIPFIKMDGLGNDFVIIDEREVSYSLTEKDITFLANRKTGVGCDQLIVIQKPENPKEHYAKMLIFNEDGSTAGACGNGTRCVGRFLMEEASLDTLKIEAPAGRILEVRKNADSITANMGKPCLKWEEIPLSAPCDTLELPKIIDELPCAVAVNVGNPHAVFFVDDVMAIDIEKYGKMIECHSLFPNRVNVEFAEVKSPTHIRMRVWERGAGVTMACGTGSCATLVAGVRRGLAERTALIEMDGGELTVSWQENGDILMTGDAHKSFEGIAFF